MKLNEINIRDPFVLPENGTYYMYGTRGETAWTKAYGLDVYTSRDLENWNGPFECFTLPDGFWGEKEIWAPEVHKYNGKYYMFASFFSEARSRATQILKSDSPMGPFLPFTGDAATPVGWTCLDGTFYVSKDNKPYIVFCHEWVQVHDGEINALQLSEDLSGAQGEPFLLLKGSYPDFVEKGKRDYVTDGPFFYRGNSGTLYMLWSTSLNGTYAQLYSKSDNGELDGNWYGHSILSDKDGGHGMIFRDFNFADRFVLHKPNRNPYERPVFFTLIEENGKLKLI